ncbi:MAG: beta-ketoacyl synthase N-terminal-like domain-containing protein, partial [Steroidobacteraceae bacterium]
MTDLVAHLLQELKAGRIGKDEVLRQLTGERGDARRAEVALHPLVQRDTSTGGEHRFASTLRPTEFFLSDHIVNGKPVLPGACHLEMARAAAAFSLGEPAGTRARMVLWNIAWLQPAVIDGVRDIHLRLRELDDGTSGFEIYAIDRGEEVIYSQGQIAFASEGRSTPPDRIDLAAVRARCERSIEGERCYEAFRASGIEYGPAHRALIGLEQSGEDESGRFVLARIELPACICATAEQYCLHPSIVDAALQASLGLSYAAFAQNGRPDEPAFKTALPFALDELRIDCGSPTRGWAFVRASSGASAAGIQKLDIDICDDTGLVCVGLSGLTLRSAGGAARAESGADGARAAAANMKVRRGGGGEDDLREGAVRYLRKLVAGALKVPVERVEAQAALEQYGIDSILALRLVRELEGAFGALPKTLMFEYQSIEALAQYFMEQHEAALRGQLKVGEAVRAGAVLAQPQPPGTAVQPVGHGRSSARPWRVRAGGERASRGGLQGRQQGLEIAIVGLSGRYPQARDVEEFWENLREGRDCISEIPAQRWDHSQYFDPQKGKAGKSYSKWGGFIEGVEEFDPMFFNISPREAQLMDPQERLFLQCVYQTLEDAGYTRQGLKSGAGGRVGVFVGVMYEEYQLYGAQAQALGQAYALGGSPSSIANRVSYFCDFHGPSMAVDTMCSSSLTAIHLACESLRAGQCEVAVAGGVNVSIHPNKYLLLSQGQFVSSTGRCESFGRGGDGYVPGEGVGAVMLKPLEQAVRQGDHIYGVIKATSINHGGKTNGYTVPNPVAQGHLIGQALRQAGVDAHAVSYIEAHGTGTSLGDPIEIAGLSQAFAEYTQQRQYCALGSAKSNIGHLESAAGIAGVTKVLLQMQHRMLVPSLHAEQLNPHIDFERTPFRVQRQLAPWSRPLIEVQGRQREYARIAGISSFGAGGANAHVIIEEYAERPGEGGADEGAGADGWGSAQRPALVVLSGKSEERLRQRAEQLLGWVLKRRPGPQELASLAYTLQVGREAMEHRLAFTASTIEQLQEKLSGYLAGKLPSGELEECYQGEVRKNKEAISSLNADEDTGELIDKWLQRGKYAKVLELWSKGLSLEWERLYGPQRPRRISLPGYPFARERYWVQERGEGAAAEAGVGMLHPLVQVNSSTLAEQRFSSTFTGREFFLAEHRVQGRAVLPGVASLEMARAALMHSLEAQERAERECVEVQQAVWLQPVMVEDEPIRVHVGLCPQQSGEIEYRIYSSRPPAGERAGVGGPGGGAGEEQSVVVHSQGRLLLRAAGVASVVDVQAVRERCVKEEIEAQECYGAFERAGIGYGEAFRTIERIYVGEGEALARLQLPRQLLGTVEQYELHPSVMDGAVQALIGALGGRAAGALGQQEGQSWVLFALDALEVRQPCEEQGWAWVRRAEQSTGEVRRFDVEVCTLQGVVCARLRGLAFRALSGAQDSRAARVAASAAAGEEPGEAVGELMLAPRWEAQAVELDSAGGERSEPLVLIGGQAEQRRLLERSGRPVRGVEVPAREEVQQIARTLQALAPFEQVMWIAPGGERAVASGAEEGSGRGHPGVLSCFRLIKALLSLGYADRALELTIVTVQGQSVLGQEEADADQASVHGLMGSVAKEQPGWRIRVVDMPREEPWPLEQVLSLPVDERGNAWAYRGAQWYRQQLLAYEGQGGQASRYRHGGVYVLLGGAGRLGEILSEYLIRNYQAQVVWIGRRELDEQIEGKITRLSQWGAAPQYIRADASDVQALQEAYRLIKQRHGRIDGLVHATLQMGGSDVGHMEESRFAAGLSAKADVSAAMRRVFAGEPLDFVLFYSSIEAFERSPRQSNYAAGSTFNDAYAQQLSREWGCAVRVMNWGYWGGGAEIPEVFLNWLRQAGFGLIEPAQGMAALEQLLAGPFEQLVYLKTHRAGALKGIGVSGERLMVAAGHLPQMQQWVAPEASGGLEPLPAEQREQVRQLQQRLCGLLCAQLQSLGLFEEPVQAWARGIGLPQPYGRWVQESVRVLQRQALIELEEDGRCRLRDEARVPPGQLWQQWEQEKSGWLEQPALREQVRLVDATLRALPQILSGRQRATDVLFPNSSMELVQGTYKSNPIADYFNGVVAETVAAFVQCRAGQPAGERLRILEIGAGTGGTSESVLRRLERHAGSIAEYCYTDLSKAFLLHAQDHYCARYPYVVTAIFDVERALAEQSIAVGGYDLVIAANVLHATRNIRATLRNAKAVLKGNGVLLLNELCGRSVFAHLTFGLLEGWWLYEDAGLRLEGTPGLSAEAWQRVLQGEGFRAVSFPAQAAHGYGQQIIVAQSDGLIRQPSRAAGRAVRAVPGAAGQSSPGGGLAAQAAGMMPGKPAAAATSHGRVREQVERIILDELSASLRLTREQIDPQQSFADYGLDSIMGVRVAEALNRALSIKLTTTSLFDYPSVERLAAHIACEYGEVLAAARGGPMQLDRSEPRAPLPQAAPGAGAPPPGAAQEGMRLRPLLRTGSGGASPAERPGAAEPGQSAVALSREPIAIIGMSGRYGRAQSVQELWQHLAQGVELIEPVRRWDLQREYAAAQIAEGCWRGAFLPDIDQFDPLFFSISGVEAAYMDPQQRLFLQESWRALEDAGYAGQCIEGRRCGVYVGCSGGDYQELLRGAELPAQAMWGGAASMLSARIAYFLDLKGPAIALDTACSSSLVAIHLACQGLRNRETDLALAGGVFVQCTPGFYLIAARAGMLSPAGRCHTFDERADGFVPGEGVGAVLLRRLSDALAEGDHVHAVIRGSAINQDGTTNGIAAPSALSQERLEREVYESFGIHPEEIQMVEAHGTGTKLGDPIEYQALTKAFRKDTERKQFCAIGSIKTNIGHTTAASGIAGVLKCVLSLQHRQIPPSLNFEKGNSHIDFENSPFFVNTSLRAWELEAGKSRCAAVSSFGMSGTNAHLVLAEAPPRQRQHAPRPGYLIALSARSPVQLREQAESLLRHCTAQHTLDCGNVSYTLLLGRKHLAHRLACIARDLPQLTAWLHQWLQGGKPAGLYASAGGERERREQLALLRYANQCIEECRAFPLGGAERHEEYLERLSSIAELYVQGYSPAFEPLFATDQYSRTPLPTYPFERRRCWGDSSSHARGDAAPHVEERPDGTEERPIAVASAPISNGPSPAVSGTPPAVTSALVGTHRVIPIWEAVAAIRQPTATVHESFEDFRVRMLVIGANDAAREEISARYPAAIFSGIGPEDDVAALVRQLQQSGAVEHVLWIAPQTPTANDEVLIGAQQNGVLHGFRIIKAFLDCGYAARALAWTVVTFATQAVLRARTIAPAHAGIHGLIGSMAKEYPQWRIRALDLDTDDDWKTSRWFGMPPDPRGAPWAYRDGQWYRAQLVAARSTAPSSAAYRRGKAYVVIGGAGHIGAAWSEWVIRRYQAKVIWIGRRRKDAAIQAKIDRLAQLGTPPEYISADAADGEALQGAYESIKRSHPQIAGVVLSPLVFEPRSLEEMDEAHFRAGLRAKVDVSVRTIQVFGHEPLDFVLFFSSLVSFIKNPRQSQYAAGCAFSDAYAHALVRRWTSSRTATVKVMNWGFWDNAGSSGAAGFSQLTQMGIGMIEAEEAMPALESLMQEPFDQMGFIKV